MKKFLCVALLGVVSSCGGSSTNEPGFTGGGGDGGTTGDDSSATGPAPLATGLAITDIALFQASKAFLFKGGAVPATVNAPVIGARPGVLRVYVTPSADWQAHEVIAELHMNTGGQDLPVATDTKTISGASDESDAATLFEFKLDAKSLAGGTTFSIAIREESGKPRDPAAGDPIYPSDGTLVDMGVVDNTGIKIKIVPVKYDADGSGRLPATDATQIARYHDTIYRMYPTSNVDMTVRAPLPWSTQIGPDGTGWDTLINGISDLRSTDGAADDVYYVAAFESDASFNNYCSQGCILGVAPLASAVDISQRLAVIVGYPGQEPADTLNQELAHAMGRSHAPCGGAGSPDPKYPYPRAGIGLYGYDVMKGTFVKPTSNVFDFMGYCTPIWISDYTFNGLARRIEFVNKAKREQPAPAPARYSWIHFAANGAMKWGRPVTLDRAPVGDAIDVALHAENGAHVATVAGSMFHYDNLPGGYVLVPEAATSAYRFATVRMNGAALPALH